MAPHLWCHGGHDGSVGIELHGGGRLTARGRAGPRGVGRLRGKGGEVITHSYSEKEDKGAGNEVLMMVVSMKIDKVLAMMGVDSAHARPAPSGIQLTHRADVEVEVPGHVVEEPP
jgi:hypothetical protein